MVLLLHLLLPLAWRRVSGAHKAGVLGHRDGEASDRLLTEREAALRLLVVLRLHDVRRGGAPEDDRHPEQHQRERRGETEVDADADPMTNLPAATVQVGPRITSSSCIHFC